MQLETDTIAAISTPPGRGGIGIVRLSGPDARSIAQPLLRLRHPLAHAEARFAEILDPETGQRLDEAVVTFFAAPHSYTTEDTLEIAAHGAPVLLDAILRHCLARGARLAAAGEFTQRAFLAGRLDLTQAEAVNDLICAHTLHQARIAAQQLGGSLSRKVAPIKQQLVELIATLEAGVDFAEDDLDVLPTEAIMTRLAAIIDPLTSLELTFSYGRIVRDGFSIAIVGRPNTGKSSLFNRLIDRDRAIVTSIPGTTRDPITEQVSLAGLPMQLVDTAGLRQAPATPEGLAEVLGVVKSRQAMAEADLVLLVFDAADLDANNINALDPPHGGGVTAASFPAITQLDPEDTATLAALKGRLHLIVLNKIDLLWSRPTVTYQPGSRHAAPLLPRLQSQTTESPVIPVSALTGEGIPELRTAILAALQTPHASGDTALLTNLRQHAAVTTALAALIPARQAVASQTPHEMVLLDLHEALHALDALTGATSMDNILRLIFSTFCIGK